MQDQLATFVQVVLPLAVPKLYTYRVPTELQNDVQPGKRVIVQLGKKKLYSALIHSITHQPPKDYEAKFLLSVLDDQVLINEKQVQFWEWMASYYMCTLGEVMNAALPAPFKLESETLITLHPDFDFDTTELTDKEHLVMEALTVAPHLKIDEIIEILQLKNVIPILKGLYDKGAVLYTENIQQAYKPKTIVCYRLTDAYREEADLQALFSVLEKKPKQLEVIMGLVHLQHSNEYVTKDELLKLGEISTSSINTLAKNGIIESYKVQVNRLASPIPETESFSLNEEQQQSYEQVKQLFTEKDVVLLHGVTSSGKTHIYVKLIEDALARQKQVLFLVPEIALTSQIVHRVKKYFGDAAIAFHSRYNQNERVELWNKVRSGEAKVIIGARSAIFLPIDELGLVIVDEEHEQSYKQYEPAPRYHARDAAIFLAHTHQCNVILGSATPAFESYYNAKQGKYGLVEMKKRFGDVPLPTIELADMAEENRVKKLKGHFTSVLLHEMEQALQRKEQVILFQNRRGYAPVVECQQCHWVPKCVNCDISLTYHKYNDSLKCHYCGYTVKSYSSCQACGSHQITLKGFGTEKIEDDLGVFFPAEPVLRLDLDSTKAKHGHDEIIRSFENQEAAIMVGTQMLSKGLDFGNVSLVGVINADQLIYFPDFRAHERAYQLLSQVSGRAGRKNRQGKVIIQTYSPDHHVLQEVLKQRYEYLYVNECEERRRFHYPPFTRLIKISVKHKDYKVAEAASFLLQKKLYTRLGENIIGPESPYVSKIRNLYIKELLVKIDRNSPHLGTIKKFILQHVADILQQKEYRQTYIICDVDPL